MFYLAESVLLYLEHKVSEGISLDATQNFCEYKGERVIFG